MTRLWTQFIDAVAVILPLPLAVLMLLVLAGIVGLLLYFFPRWVPHHLPHFGRPHWRPRWPSWQPRWPGWRLRWRWQWPDWRAWLRKRRRKRTSEADLEQAIDELESSDEELPDVPPEVFVSLADRLAAEGHYAEAIRERLRAIVRDLVNRGLIEHRPGWTVTELAIAAAAVRPSIDGPLSAATVMFSDIWYGQRPASADDDAQMRALSAQLTQALTEPVGATI